MRLDPHVVRTAVLGLLAAFGPLAGSPAAQAQSDAAKAMVGSTWELSNADRDRTCTINFKLGPSSASYPIELDGKCQQAFPALRGIAAWTFGRNDNLQLVDAAGKQVLELLEVEAGLYEGLRPNEGRYILQNAAVAAASRDRPADDLFGEWSFVRGGAGKPISSSCASARRRGRWNAASSWCCPPRARSGASRKAIRTRGRASRPRARRL